MLFKPVFYAGFNAAKTNDAQCLVQPEYTDFDLVISTY